MKRVTLLLLLSACAGEQHPISFVVPRADSARLARALEQAGQPAEQVVDASGVTTRWLDTGLGYGFVGGHRANLFRRFVASIQGDAVTLRVETQRCARGSWDETASVGACELLQGLLPSDRAALAEVAEKVRVSVGGH